MNDSFMTKLREQHDAQPTTVIVPEYDNVVFRDAIIKFLDTHSYDTPLHIVIK